MTWLHQRRAYIETKYFDSINDIDPENFDYEMKNICHYILERLEELSISDDEFFKKTGLRLSQFQKSDELSFKDWVTVKAEQWFEIADVLQVNKVWLTVRATKAISNMSGSVTEKIDWKLLDTVWELKNIKKKNTLNIPVAADGTLFHPGLKMRKGYQIGKRNVNQHYVVSFDDALKELQKMKTPYWRRPSPTSGVYGTVRGVGWKEIGKTELYKLAK